MRPQYRLASHGVHGGARGGALNVWEADGRRLITVGPQNQGLGDPGHGTLLALAQISAAFVNAAPEDEHTVDFAIGLAALSRLVDQARNAFQSAESLLDDTPEAM